MSDQPLVSVVVPAFNHAQYLPTCLDAIWFQDYPNLEILVINPASTDNTAEVLEAYEGAVQTEEVSWPKKFNEESGVVERVHEPRYSSSGRSLKVVTLDEDPGLPETYNIGLREARGTYIAPVVSDDTVHPEFVSALVDALEGGADFAYGDQYLVDEDGRICQEMRFPGYDPKTCLADWYRLGVARMWRASLHENAGYMDPEFELCHDYDLIFRFAEAGARFIHVPRVLYSVLIHGSNRQTGSHTPERKPRIHEESKVIARKVSDWLAQSQL